MNCVPLFIEVGYIRTRYVWNWEKGEKIQRFIECAKRAPETDGLTPSCFSRKSSLLNFNYRLCDFSPKRFWLRKLETVQWKEFLNQRIHDRLSWLIIEEFGLESRSLQSHFRFFGVRICKLSNSAMRSCLKVIYFYFEVN